MRYFNYHSDRKLYANSKYYLDELFSKYYYLLFRFCSFTNVVGQIETYDLKRKLNSMNLNIALLKSIAFSCGHFVEKI